MVEQLNPASKLLSAAKLLFATLLLLRLGGVGAGLLPAARISLLILALLLGYERVIGAFAAHGREATVARWRAWAYEHRFALGLAAITAAALALRLFGINRDLGHVAVSIDENRLNTSVLHLFQTGEIEYRTVEHYPGIHYWMLTGTYLVAFVWGLMTDVARNLDEMAAIHFVAFGRVVSALQSSATVLLSGLLGRRLAGVRAGLFAAAALALAPLSVSLGRQLRNDAAATMLIVAAVLLALGVYRRGFHGAEAVFAGAFAGLAAGVKYTGVFVLLPVLLAAATSEDRERRWRALALAGGGFLAAALLSNHFVWADIPNLTNQLAGQILITGESHWAAQANPAFYHLQILAQQVVGWPLLLLAGATLAYRLSAGNWRWWLFAAYPLSALWFVAQRPSQLPRWVYPEAPFAAVAAGAGLVALIDLVLARLPAHRRARATRAAATTALVASLLFAPLLWRTTTSLARQLSAPTWTLTEQWLQDNAAAGDRILVQRQWLQFEPGRLEVERESLAAVLDKGSYELAANDWIVVHEELLAHPALAELRRATQITVDASFFGNQGPDFAVFEPPPLAPVETPLEVQLDNAAAERYLGHEWPPRRARGNGRLLPDRGAGLYLPPLGGQSLTLELIVAAPSPGESAPAITVVSHRQRLAVATADRDDGSRMFTIELPLRIVGPGAVPLLLRPAAGSGAVRLLGFRLR